MAEPGNEDPLFRSFPRHLPPPRSREARMAQARVCPYDADSIALCPFNDPLPPKVARRTTVDCRYFSVEATSDGFIGVCRRRREA